MRFSLVSLAAVALSAVLAGCGGSSRGDLQGRVVKSGNAPVADTRLDLVPLESGGEAQHRTTNARGGYAFADVKKGRYRVSVRYGVSGVFECAVRFPVEILAGKTVLRRFEIPLVDVAPDATATLPNGRKTTCETLKNPLRTFLCQSLLFPVGLYALPPRTVTAGYGDGWRGLGVIARDKCRSLRVLGRVGKLPSARLRPFGWMLVSLPGRQGWINPWIGRRLPAQLRAWQDVALVAAGKLPQRQPTLGKALPDLAFTTAYLSENVGDFCTEAGQVYPHWLVSVRNRGKGLSPKQVEVAFDPAAGDSELWTIGNARWVRGLASGESMEVHDTKGPERSVIVSYARLTVDPNNKVREADESNNELTTAVVPNLVCVLNP